jgi:hypothetical protein
MKDVFEAMFISALVWGAAGVMLLSSGCIVSGPLTVSVFSSRMVVASTNVTQTIDGGAAVIPSIGLGDAVTSNLATTAKDAFETSSGIKAGSAAAAGAGQLLGAKLP